ncbi:MAG TPA: AAA family ATPase [Anaerolineae bacterium]|nr:AAA family ATPase [Anaerolineae bacterium]
MGEVYAIANQKGGVGKTTTTVNVGAYLAASGKKVLLVDIDPQGNATSSLGIDKGALTRSIYEVLIENLPMAQAVMLTRRLGLDLVPASAELAGAEVEMVGLISREYRLQKALASIRDKYDWVLIDCPPSLGLLTVNALTAADGVLIPVQCEFLPLEGLSQLQHTINLVRDHLNPRLTIRGVVLTMYDTRTNLAQQVVEEVRRFYAGRVFATIIPRNVRLSEAPSYGEPILDYAPTSSGGLAYRSLANEILANAARG